MCGRATFQSGISRCCCTLLSKGVICLIIIRDETMNVSYSFVATREGYFAADAKIQEIVGMGHRVGGDVGKVREYCK